MPEKYNFRWRSVRRAQSAAMQHKFVGFSVRAGLRYQGFQIPSSKCADVGGQGRRYESTTKKTWQTCQPRDEKSLMAASAATMTDGCGADGSRFVLRVIPKQSTAVEWGMTEDLRRSKWVCG